MRKSAAGSFFLAVFALLVPAQAQHGIQNDATGSDAPKPDVCTFEPGAVVSDACASFADLDKINKELNPLIHSLVTDTDFFSYYRLNLYNKVCPFWSDENGACGNIACAVTTLENEDDIPEIWRAQELSRLEGPKAHHPGRKEQRERPQKPLMGELGENVGESCVVEYDDECDDRDYCVPEDESASAKGDYVSLIDNPERFTGYAGDGANQVWQAIYRENCFARPKTSEQSMSVPGLLSPAAGPLGGAQGQAAQDFRSVLKQHSRQQALQSGSLEDTVEFEDECLEKRVFYRVVSGMHASISTHLCYDYLNQSTGKWSPNLQCYKERLHTHPERLSNLYFNFALVSRAVGKLKDYAQDYTFCTGDPQEDMRTRAMIAKVADVLSSGPEIFDESVMFQDDYLGETGITLKEDFRNRFRNVSRIMDCVGCDKCRLWGKLQTAGFGTALKVLFEFGDEAEPQPSLRRTELVALINTLDKISHALKAVAHFEAMITKEEQLASSKPSPPQKQLTDFPEEEEDDDDYEEFNRVEDEESTGRSAKDELLLFYNVTCYIIKSWLGLPSKLWRIFVIEMARLWQRWLGLEIWDSAWEIRLPGYDALREPDEL